MSYWAVAKGHAPGIYGNKKDCNAQTEGHPAPLWKKFPLTPCGFEAAKEFILEHRQKQERDGVSLDDSEEEEEEEEDGTLLIRIDTNWTKDRDGKKHQFVSQGPPQYSVLFDLDGDDPRNLYALYTMRGRKPTRERCVEMGLMAFFEWTHDPETARYRRGTDPLMQFEDIAVFDPSAIKHIIIQQPCAALEKKYMRSASRRRGMERLICWRMRSLKKEHGIEITLITVDPDEEKKRLGIQ